MSPWSCLATLEPADAVICLTAGIVAVVLLLLLR